MGDGVREQLALARESLLDLSARNRLLNFRPTKRTTVEIVDELPGEVWRLLFAEERKLAFLAKEEHQLFDDEGAADASGEFEPEEISEEPPTAPLAELVVLAAAADEQSEAPEPPLPPAEPAKDDADDAIPEAELDEHDLFAQPDVTTALERGGELPERYTDLFLQTPLTDEALQTNLLRIDQTATTAVTERGVNLLFLAMGFLRWIDKDDPKRTFLAPLVLLPVGLERSSARHRFKVAALEDDPVLNPCLARKLTELGIDLPAAPDDWGDFDVPAHLQAVRDAVAERDGWDVVDDIYLGFFSFTKYLMYVDLDPARWATNEDGQPALLTNPLVRSLCGADDVLEADDDAELPDASQLDELFAPDDLCQVMDADSSQQMAILAARRGRSLVIEGPPGTGKSQTITNIIAECLGAGRTVLFVSEKLAALEVVKGRLDRVGLGDFCLELHSTKANRRAVAAELERVISKGRASRPEPDSESDKLQRLRRRLNRYVDALHAPDGPSGMTPYEAIGRLALLSDVPEVACDLPGFAEWDRERIDELKGLVAELGRQSGRVWPPGEHTWRGARVAAMTPRARREAEQLVGATRKAAADIRDAATGVAALTGAAEATDLAAARATLDAATTVLNSPKPARRLLHETIWKALSPELREMVDRIGRYVEGLHWMTGRYDLPAFRGADWRGVHDRSVKHWGSWTRVLRWSYWSDRMQIRRTRQAGHAPKLDELAGDVEQLSRLEEIRRALEASDELGKDCFDAAWCGAESDWEALADLAAWLTDFHRLVQAGWIDPGGADLAAPDADTDKLATATEMLHRRLAAWSEAWDALVAALQINDEIFDGPVAGVGLGDLLARLDRMAAEAETLFEWARYQAALQACEQAPVADFAAAAEREGIEPELLALTMEKQFLQQWAEHALVEREELSGFDGTAHEADRLAFAHLDRQSVRAARVRLHSRIVAERPLNGVKAAPSSQLGILQGEARRKRGGRSIRKLLSDAPDAIQKLKPCFMMSPLSVSQFLASGGMRFDVVIFDEASQVEPADALGAVARGRQLVLVGDPKQLPPTDFFRVTGEAPTEALAGLADMESILDRGAVVLPAQRLKWHYRSRHESLIAFSNTHFYDGGLVTFPSAHTDRAEYGLSMVYHGEDVYDRGGTQTNRDQARRIAHAVFDHARQRGDVTLGVGAFSRAQQLAILDEVEKLRREDNSVEAFFDRDRPEPFFVKNLESIQGDERDVIFLSVGYGRDRDRKITMNFGPLNKDNGWRRLNVLITRARRRCVVFTSIRAEDIDLTSTQSRGVEALKGYLEFAAAGEPAGHPAVAGGFASSFEQAVSNALVSNGLAVHSQIGSGGFVVDLAVVDAAHSGQYLLGIECDGATYGQAATARDRDRLRQQVLEGLGWRIHRVWAADWLRTPARQVQSVLDAVEAARKRTLRPTMTEAGAAAPEDGEADATVEAGEQTMIPSVPYRRHTARPGSPEEFYTAQPGDLAALAETIIRTEGPVHTSVLTRRIAACFGLARAGARIHDRVALAVQLNTVTGKAVEREDFLWPGDMEQPPVRVRTDEDDRDIDLICPEEIAVAARLLLEAQFGMNRTDLITQAARALGFASAGSRITERVGEVVQADIDAGRIAVDTADYLTVRE